MRLVKFFRRFMGHKQHYVPVFAQQATYLQQASKALCNMMDTTDPAEWRRFEREVKACEIQGDALLADFQEQLYENIFSSGRVDMQTIAMNMDEFLDYINDSAKSVPLYMPQRIDSQLRDLAQYIHAEANAVKTLVGYLGDMKKNLTLINVECERITELEHAADDSYLEYIGWIFTEEKNAIELMKYKNIAETLEATTDSAKRLSDSVRKIVLRYVE